MNEAKLKIKNIYKKLRTYISKKETYISNYLSFQSLGKK